MFRTLLTLLLPATLLVAQGNPGAEGLRPDPGDLAAHARIALRLNAIRTQRIKAALGSPESQARGIADQWGQFDLESHRRRLGMRAARQRVQEVLMLPGTEEEKNLKIVPIVNQFAAIQKQQKEAKQKFEEDIQHLLTPAQQGRFIILMEEFQRNLLEAMGEPHHPK